MYSCVFEPPPRQLPPPPLPLTHIHRFALGDLSADDMTWIVTYKERLNLPAETEWFFMYALSLHWALTQFTPAAMDVVAVNTSERLFSLFATLSGLIMFSFFIGSINQFHGRSRKMFCRCAHANRKADTTIPGLRGAPEFSPDQTAYNS